jgi:hypothetical protein
VTKVRPAGGCRGPIATLVFLCTLSACHTTPGVDRLPPRREPAPVENPAPPPLSPDEKPPEHAEDVPVETPVAPPDLPPEAPPPKRRSKPRPEPPPPPPPAAAPAAPSTDAEVKPLDNSVVTVLGKKVQGAKGEDLGRVVDVLADATGRVRIAVIEFGGFLGVGNRRIAVDWSLLRFNPDDQNQPLILSVSRNKLQSAPEYKNAAQPQALMAPQPPAPAVAPASGAAPTPPAGPTPAAPPTPAPAPAPNAPEGKK